MPILVALLFLALCPPLSAVELPGCGVASSWDLHVFPDSLLFERAGAVPERVELRFGRLRVDGVDLDLGSEERDRVALFEADLRNLVPRVRDLGQRGLGLVVAAVRSEVAAAVPGPAARAGFERRLNSEAAALRREIATTTTTRDWRPDVLEPRLQRLGAELVTELARGAGVEALARAMAGDPSAALLAGQGLASLDPEQIARALTPLEAQIRGLCPDLRELQELQQGLRDAGGRPLALLEPAGPS